MNLLIEAAAAEWSGLLDHESIPQEDKVELYQKISLVGRASYRYPDGSACNGHKFKGSKASANAISKLLKFGYYALMWNSKEVQIIFKNRIFSIENTNPFCAKSMEKVIEYGRKVGLKRMYFDHLRETMQEVKKQVQVPYKASKEERKEADKNSKNGSYEQAEVLGWKPGRA